MYAISNPVANPSPNYHSGPGVDPDAYTLPRLPSTDYVP